MNISNMSMTHLNKKNYKKHNYEHKHNQDEESLKKARKRNKFIIKKVDDWQNFPFLKHLTCQNKKCGEKLVPKESRSRVILVCPKCKSVQHYVPIAVIQTNLVISEKLKKAKRRNRIY